MFFENKMTEIDCLHKSCIPCQGYQADAVGYGIHRWVSVNPLTRTVKRFSSLTGTLDGD